jgi:protein SCO1/2
VCIALTVLAAGASNLDLRSSVRPAVGGDARARLESASAQSLSGSSLYQLESTWTNDRGERVKLKDLGGATEVMAMVFTRCPTVCPTLVHDLKAMDKSMPGGAHKGTHFVLITIDPEHDTPAVLREFRDRMGLDPQRWTLLRGSESDTRELTAVLGLAYGKGDGQNFAHSSLVTVLDRGGVIVHQQTGVGTDPMRAVAAIENTLPR